MACGWRGWRDGRNGANGRTGEWGTGDGASPLPLSLSPPLPLSRRHPLPSRPAPVRRRSRGRHRARTGRRGRDHRQPGHRPGVVPPGAGPGRSVCARLRGRRRASERLRRFRRCGPGGAAGAGTASESGGHRRDRAGLLLGEGAARSAAARVACATGARGRAGVAGHLAQPQSPGRRAHGRGSLLHNRSPVDNGTTGACDTETRRGCWYHR